jgi:hypothetical protein
MTKPINFSLDTFNGKEEALAALVDYTPLSVPPAGKVEVLNLYVDFNKDDPYLAVVTDETTYYVELKTEMD